MTLSPSADHHRSTDQHARWVTTFPALLLAFNFEKVGPVCVAITGMKRSSLPLVALALMMVSTSVADPAGQFELYMARMGVHGWRSPRSCPSRPPQHLPRQALVCRLREDIWLPGLLHLPAKFATPSALLRTMPMANLPYQLQIHVAPLLLSSVLLVLAFCLTHVHLSQSMLDLLASGPVQGPVPLPHQLHVHFFRALPG